MIAQDYNYLSDSVLYNCMNYKSSMYTINRAISNSITNASIATDLFVYLRDEVIMYTASIIHYGLENPIATFIREITDASQR